MKVSPYNLPALPKLRHDGSYDPISLEQYIEICKRRRIKDKAMAEHLNVPFHRIVFALGKGRICFRRHAEFTAAARRGLM